MNISEKLQRTSLPLLYLSLVLSKSPVSKILLLILKPSQGVGKGKEVLSSTKDTQFEDALTIKDVVSQAKVAESKSEARDAELKAVDSKEGP